MLLFIRTGRVILTIAVTSLRGSTCLSHRILAAVIVAIITAAKIISILETM